MLAAFAAATEVTVWIKRIVEGGHRISCATLQDELRKEHAIAFRPASALMTQHFRQRLAATKTRDKRKFVAQLRDFAMATTPMPARDDVALVLDPRIVAFESSVEATLLIDPYGD